MPWFRHHYSCQACDGSWFAEAAVVVESDCPFCAARDVFAYKSDDRTLIVEREGAAFVVFEAAKSARAEPGYRQRKRFATRAKANAFVAARRRKPTSRPAPRARSARSA
ncbi:MAG TPA: hypothetical protein VMG39_11465 [Pseudolabrys sp.]|nr:hypothetical protein [Pseudolabrys sp.]